MTKLLVFATLILPLGTPAQKQTQTNVDAASDAHRLPAPSNLHIVGASTQSCPGAPLKVQTKISGTVLRMEGDIIVLERDLVIGGLTNGVERVGLRNYGRKPANGDHIQVWAMRSGGLGSGAQFLEVWDCQRNPVHPPVRDLPALSPAN